MHFDLTLPSQPGDPKIWSGLTGCSAALALSDILSNTKQFIVLLTPDSLTATQLEDELKFFSGSKSAYPILHFPDWETLAYDHFSPHQDIISARLTCLYQLPQLTHGILILPITTLLHRLSQRDFVESHSFMLACGDTIDIDAFRTRLQANGYLCVNQVMAPGEFAVRGSIIDLYPMGSDDPLRIDLFDNEVESIRLFDPDTQRSTEKIQQIHLLPAKEFPLTEQAITLFRQQWRANFQGNPMNCPIYQDVSEGICSAGIEYYLPLFFDHTNNLFDYLPTNTVIVNYGDLQEPIAQFNLQIQQRYEQLKHDVTRPILPPASLFLTAAELTQKLTTLPMLTLEKQITNTPNALTLLTKKLPTLPINHKASDPLAELKNFITQNDDNILICAESAGRRETLLTLFAEHNTHPKNYQTWQDFITAPSALGITVAPLTQGLWLPNAKLILITETQLYGDIVLQRRRRQKMQRGIDPDAIIRNLAELRLGEPIVHIEHGVGRYLGLQTLAISNIDTEFLTLEYANHDKLYVPVASLNLISRYTGGNVDNAPLNKLGTDQWQKAKRKAAEKIRDVAAELLDIYARRANHQGKAYQQLDHQYQAFANEFPFEETPDQQTSIDAVIQDLTSTKIMDRLVCGDVGFGKTEVAMRAAFFAVNNNHQVALLVPTTLLAQQHYENFSDRFAQWPVNVELISRFKSKKEQQIILNKLAEGKIDIIIGTHRLIQNDIKFSDLGLLIVDEEHRFGVRHKEKIKEKRAHINILTLTATPIPRTLNLSLSGVRDLSMITTPPARRLAIKTFIHEHKEHLIIEAIRREILRGGQIYYLHNNVQSITKVADKLMQLVPEARVGVAHGQMRERELERVMTDFYHHRFNVLVCTTIIESGIDIPTANTIIIDRADKFGLAQLHQLRGRVGRSHHQAYAYLLIPGRKLISADAQKRLDALTSLEDLGAGFTLASHDLEIRGAGEFLGEEQSGHIQTIGFSLYMELLDDALKSLKAGKQPDFATSITNDIEIELQISALIPDTYLADVHQRLMLYKRIASAANETALNEIQVEMIDRFGLLPEATKHLFAATLLKLKAKPFGIRKIEANQKGGRIIFNAKANIDPLSIIQLIQTEPKQYQFDGGDKFRFHIQTETATQRITMIEELLKKFRYATQNE